MPIALQEFENEVVRRHRTSDNPASEEQVRRVLASAANLLRDCYTGDPGGAHKLVGQWLGAVTVEGKR